jgi:hypothetical protein
MAVQASNRRLLSTRSAFRDRIGDRSVAHTIVSLSQRIERNKQ